VRVLVLADTHVRRGGARRLPDSVYAELDRADAIVHAGDLVAAELLDELAGFAPVHAVLGNNDAELVGTLPETRHLSLAGVTVAVIHDAGPRAGRERRMSRRFPDARVVVYGHSHIPDDRVGIGDQRLFNPGSPTDRRSQPRHTFGVLELEHGAVRSHRVVPVES
jgi:putative phosphoesterase